MSRDMSTAGRVYQGLRGDDGERYVPLIQLPGNATTRHAQAALAYLRLHALELVRSRRWRTCARGGGRKGSLPPGS